MKKTTVLPVVLLLLICGCTTAKHLNFTQEKTIQTSAVIQTIPVDDQKKDYQPSGKIMYSDNEIITDNLMVLANLQNFSSRDTKFQQIESNYINAICLEDTTRIISAELVELQEANQSYTLGLFSSISLVAGLIFALAGIAIFSVTFFLAAIILGILGLRMGFIAKRILKENRNVYSNSKKATWGVILSLPVFACMIAFFIAFIYLMITYSGF